MMVTLLLESAVRSLGLGLAVWIGLKVFRIRSAQAQRIVWTVVLVSAVLMPLLMQWRTVSLPAPAAASQWIPAAVAPRAVVASEARPPQPYLSVLASRTRDWRAIAVDAYLLVAGVLLLRLMIGLMLTFRLVRNAEADFGIRDLDVRVSASVPAPVTFGSTILVPRAWLTWDALTRRAILSHERSHIERRDFYFQLLASLHRAAFWFSPLTWWLQKRLSELAELESDDAAIIEIEDSSKYAEILVDIARRARPSLDGVAMARPATLGRRIERILAGKTAGIGLGPFKRAALVLCIVPLVGLMAGSCLRSYAQSPQPAPTIPLGPSITMPSMPHLPSMPRMTRMPIMAPMPIDDGGVGFILVTSDSKSVYVSPVDARRVESLRGTISGDFILFRQDSKDYVVTDPQTVQRAKDIIQPIELAQAELGRRQAELGAQQADLGAQEARLGEQRANVTVAAPDLTKALDELRAHLVGLSGKNLRRDEIGDIQARIGTLQAVAGSLQATAGEQQAQLGQEHAMLGEQQAALGAQQASLGEQQARKAQELMQEIRTLIDEIQRSGQARPAP